MPKQPIYLDYCATTPVDKRVMDKMIPYFSGKFGNPSSREHLFGWMAEEAVSEAREACATLIGSKPEELIFTSGATEAINLALRGVAEDPPLKHIVSVKTEHKAMLDTLKVLERRGTEVSLLPVDGQGRIDPDEFSNCLRPDTGLIAVMLGNNETGVMHPIKELAARAKASSALFFCDATQSAGRIPIDVKELDVDLLVFSGHKLYGPKGVGLLYCRPGVKEHLAAQLTGGGQEQGLRSGTLNVPAIVGFGEACSLAIRRQQEDTVYLSGLRDDFEEQVRVHADVYIHSVEAPRLPHVSNLLFRETDGAALMARLRKFIACSRSSACSSVMVEPSHVIRAMHFTEEEALASFRFSFGRPTTREEASDALRHLADCLEAIKQE